MASSLTATAGIAPNGLDERALAEFAKTVDIAGISLPARLEALQAAWDTVEVSSISQYWRVDYNRIDLSGSIPTSLMMDLALSDEAREKGVVLCSLADAMRNHAALLERGLFATVASDEAKFIALTTAFAASGYFLSVPSGVKVGDPIRITLRVPIGTRAFARSVVLVAEDAEISVIEELQQFSDPGTSTAAGQTTTVGTVTETLVAERGRVSHAVIQQLDAAARVFSIRRAFVEAEASSTVAIADLGAALARSSVETRLIAPGASAATTCLFFSDKERHMDTVIELDHVAGNTTSDTLAKGGASGSGRARFLGNVRMAPGAHGCEANLRDDALLLSADAHIDSIPALEISANDVKAFHGATVGTIDHEQRFYLMSRGVTQAEADRLITLGFFAPAIDRFPTETLRERLRSTIAEAVT